MPPFSRGKKARFAGRKRRETRVKSCNRFSINAYLGNLNLYFGKNALYE
jgi:hypothetical protein